MFWTLNCFFDCIGYLMLPAFLITIPILVQKVSRHNADKLIGEAKTKDLTDYPLTYDALSAIEAATLFVIIYRMLCLFRINRYFDITYQTIMGSFRLFVPYVVVTLVILLSCAALTQSLWGTFNNEYRSFGSAFLHTTIAAMEGPETDFWMFKSSDWSVVYFLCFFIWVTLLIPSACIGVFIETYRITTLKLGYPEQYKEERWDLKGYLQWLFQCCPVGLRNKFGLNDEAQDEANESDKN
eukprot:TRINITY_DN5092_c0_g1_i3.p1 TRINITY_DN5092_c0_g1~~TRINITY_DN5092_c0_g1_i3.p1  ORF type:complete len:240 (+),score=67.17 TRINITY_DN5092_c0_g1_i3:369-1088(+)